MKEGEKPEIVVEDKVAKGEVSLDKHEVEEEKPKEEVKEDKKVEDDSEASELKPKSE